MHIKIQGEYLIEGLRVLERIATKHPSLPLLESILVSVTGKDIVLRATNLDTGFEYTAPGIVLGGGSCACLPHLLLSAITGAEKEEVELRLVDGTLHVVTSSSEVFIKTFQTEDFPVLPRFSQKETRSIELHSKDLLSLLKSVSFSVAQTDLKPELASVYLKVVGKNIVSVGTDAFRLAEKKLTLTEPKAESEPLLLPGKVATDIMKILDTLPEQELLLKYSDTQISFETGFWFVTGRLIQGNYPNYTQIIPTSSSTKATVFRKDLQALLKPLSLFSDKDLRMDIKFDTSKKALVFTTDSHDRGRATYTLKCALEGESLDIRINYKYLNDFLSQTTDESLLLRSSGSSSPLVIEPVHEGGFLYLLMPMFK
jgi:DNA polymerase-3 subunit beta